LFLIEEGVSKGEVGNSATIMSLGGLDVFAMAEGTVDFFNDTGGYGFIETEDADEDVFFHMEDIGGPDLEEGQELEFEIEQAPKGPRATEVTRL
jgi:CspA family cold shock protein